MAKTMMYTCDVCKQSKSKDDLAHLSIKSEGILISGCDRYLPLEIDVCKDCLKKKGFVVEIKSDEELAEVKKQNKLTLEDKIYDILEDLGVAFCE